MNFDLDDDQRLLKESVDRLLLDHYAFEQRRGYAAGEHGHDDAMWARYAELGLLALPFATDDGGLGLGRVETAIVMEAFGRALILEPYLATIVLAGGVLRHGASAAQRATLVPAIAEGRLKMALAHGERGARYDLSHVESRVAPHGEGLAISGAKSLVLHGDSADRLIVSAREDGAPGDAAGVSLFVVDPASAGVERRGYPTQDGLRAAEIGFDRVVVTDADRVGAAGAGGAIVARVADEAIAGLCAESIGVMDALVAATTDYLKVRHQFGVAIGSFQALQHRAADMVVMLEQARSMALFATMMAGSDDAPARARAVHAAKVQIGRSGRFIGQQAVQLHGGIGVTMEYKVGHLFKRLTMIELAFGDADHHLARLAELGGLDG